MSKFRHGQTVTLTDGSGKVHAGTLHLPDVVTYGPGGPRSLPREVYGQYGVYTIARKDGALFRTEGRLSVMLCDNAPHGCFDLFNCCSCGGVECGCGYCFDCNACEACREEG